MKKVKTAKSKDQSAYVGAKKEPNPAASAAKNAGLKNFKSKAMEKFPKMGNVKASKKKG